MTTTPNLVTQSEFAALLGKDKSYVSRLKKNGRLVMVQTEEGERVDVEASQALIAETADLSRAKEIAANKSSGHTVVVSGKSYRDLQVEEKQLDVEKKATELKKMIGQLVDADEARLFAADLAASFRGALEILPDRLAPELVPLSDTEAVRAVLVESFEQVLTDLADKIRRWGGGSDTEAEAIRLREEKIIEDAKRTEARQAASERVEQTKKEEAERHRIEVEQNLSDAQRAGIENAREALRIREEVLRKREEELGIAGPITIQSHSVIDHFEIAEITRKKREESRE